MVQIIIAPDSFKSCLTAQEAARAMCCGIKRVNAQINTQVIPLADGGIGTVDALVSATGGKMITLSVTGPLGDPVRGYYGVLGDGKTAVIEAAAASGLHLISPESQNPLLTTSLGSGTILKHVIAAGYRTIIMGVGDTATHDGGTGLLQALGARFFNLSGGEITRPMCGCLLEKIGLVDISGFPPELGSCQIIVACDVTNPLLGERGCAHAFSPQKGADSVIVERLESGMTHFSACVESLLNSSFRDQPGTGAGGGLAMALSGFLGGKIESGIDIVLEVSGFNERLLKADLVLTGEGSLDHQTLFGKTVSGVVNAAVKHSVPVIGIAGTVSCRERLLEMGLSEVVSIGDSTMSRTEKMSRAEELIAAAATQIVVNMGWNP
jgi:glycerate 2-kinase